mgnify:CR=1 FL=1
MPRQPVRNKDYNNRDTSYRGICPRFNKAATLSIHLSGVKIAKTDLDLGFHVAGFECNILNDINDRRNTCRLDCPIMEEYKNSHSY